MVAILLALLVPGALYAQDLSLQTELDARVTQIKLSDGRTATAFHFEPNYQLSWRGPLLGGTNTYADFDSSGGLASDPGVWDMQQDYHLDLHAVGEAVNLDLSLSRSLDSFSTAQPGGGRQTLTSRTDSLSVNAILAYPGYPLISLQHQLTRASTAWAGTVEASGTLIGGNYDWGPLRMSLDQQWQDSDFAPSFESTQYGLNFNTWLTPMAQLTAYHYGSFARTGDAAGGRLSNLTTTVKLSAEPTPFLVMDGELTHASSDQSGLGLDLGGSFTSHALTLRSDPLPGVRLDLSERGQLTQAGVSDSHTQFYTAELGLTPAPDTQVLALLSDSRFSVTGDRATSHQRQEQLSFSTPLFGCMDLAASYDRSVYDRLDAGYDSRSFSVGLVGELTATTQANLTYRQDRERSRGTAGLEDWNSQSVQAQVNWLPDPNWDLTLGIDAVRTKNISTTTTFAPIIETRWNMSPSTMLTLRYNLQSTSETNPRDGGPPFSFSGISSYLDAQLTYQISDTESIELAYDNQQLAASGTQFQRMLEMRWLKQF